MEIGCLKGEGNFYWGEGNFYWGEGFTYRDVFLVEQPDGYYFLYLKKNGKQVSPGSMDTTWCFFDRDIYVPPAYEIECYKKLLNKENDMDTKERIEKLEKELARLREIVETKKEKKIVYDEDNLYVGINGEGEPFLLSRMGFKYSFLSGCRQWCMARDNGQELIDNANRKCLFTVYEFSNALEGMEFFMDKYRKCHKED